MTAVYNLALAPSAMAKTRLHRSRPSPVFTLMMISNVSKHVFSSVIHLPKKFSCISDQVSSPQERVLFPSEVHSQGQSSCTASTWDYNAEKEFERSRNTTPVATEPTTTWEARPILPMEQLEAALSLTSLALDESATPTPDTSKRSKPSRRLSISVVSPLSHSHISSPLIQLLQRSPNPHPSTRESVVFRPPSTSGSSELHFRPLSPPPDHLRRRNAQHAVTPPPSPHRSQMHQRPRTVSLHQVLSRELPVDGEGEIPDVPPVNEMQQHVNRVLSRE